MKISLSLYARFTKSVRGWPPTSIATVAVWIHSPAAPITPALASVGPDVAQPGVQVTLAGSFAGTNTVKFGTTAAVLVSSSTNQIIVTAPSISNGNYNVTVTDSRGHVSNSVPFTILAAKLIPVTFTVNNATPTAPGDYIFLTGDTGGARKLEYDVGRRSRPNADAELPELASER